VHLKALPSVQFPLVCCQGQDYLPEDWNCVGLKKKRENKTAILMVSTTIPEPRVSPDIHTNTTQRLNLLGGDERTKEPRVTLYIMNNNIYCILITALLFTPLLHSDVIG